MLFGPCAKHRTQAVLVAENGQTFVGENVCLSPQAVCPRLPGEGYEKCKTVCKQLGHAEEHAIAAAGPLANGATITVTHWYACDKCKALCEASGIKEIRFTLKE